MTNDADIVAIMRSAMIVIGSHNMYPNSTTFFSAHGLYGETSTEGRDLNACVCLTATKLLAHELEFGHEQTPAHSPS